MTVVTCNNNECFNNKSNICQKYVLSIYQKDENECSVCEDVNVKGLNEVITK